MTKASEPVDYLAAIEQMRRKEQDKRNQIHSPDLVPQEEEAVDYMAVSKAWDKALQGRNERCRYMNTGILILPLS